MSRGDLRRAERASQTSDSIAESEARHRAIVDALPLAVVLQDPAGQILTANQAARALGVSLRREIRLDAVPALIPSQTHHIDLTGVSASLTSPAGAPARAVASGKVERDRIRHPDGSPDTWLAVESVPLTDDRGRAHAVVTTLANQTGPSLHPTPTDEPRPAADVAVLQTAERALQHSEELFSTTMDHTPIGMALVAEDGRLLKVNRSLCSSFGWRRDELQGRELTSLLHPDARQTWAPTLTNVVSGSAGQAVVEQRFQGQGGMELWGTLTVARVPAPDGGPGLTIAQFMDLSSIRRAHELLTQLQLNDGLTGLPNRTVVLDQANQALDRSRDSGHHIGILVCDVDQFRVINDSLGHELGDALLITLARRIQQALPPRCLAGRLSGDGFVVLCESIRNDADAIAIAEKIQEAVAQPASVGRHTVIPTVSIGIAVSPNTGAEPLDLLRDADAATNRAKRFGRNRWDMVDTALRKSAVARLDIEDELRRGLAAGELRLHFQPIVDLSSGRIVGREALVRWIHPQRGLISPADFLPVAEESGLIHHIGRWVLTQAAATAAISRAQEYVAVNVSPSQLASPGLAHDVEDILNESGLDSSRLVVELTESVMLSAAPTARAELNRLQDLGVRVVVDDFGTGFSALSYLRDLPVSGIKVDRSFTAGLGRDTQCERIIAALTGLGHGLGMDVVVEGVETEEQRAMLTQLGAEHAQGYLFGRPSPTFDTMISL